MDTLCLPTWRNPLPPQQAALWASSIRAFFGPSLRLPSRPQAFFIHAGPSNQMLFFTSVIRLPWSRPAVASQGQSSLTYPNFVRCLYPLARCGLPMTEPRSPWLYRVEIQFLSHVEWTRSWTAQGRLEACGPWGPRLLPLHTFVLAWSIRGPG